MKNKWKVLGGAAVAFALVVAPMSGAFADDAPAPDDTTAPVVEQSPAPEATEVSAPEQTTAPAPEEKAPSVQTQKPDATKTMRWILPDGGTAQNVTWPQAEATDANLAALKCETTVTIQVDVYKYSTREQKATVDGLNKDGVLTNGEDHSVIKSWTFETFTAPECPKPPVIHQCESYSTHATTDLSTWNLSETRANGHNALVPGGLHVWTDDASSLAKAAGYYPADFYLRDSGGFSMDWTGTGVKPGGQMMVDLNDDGTPEGYFVVEDAYGPNSAWLSANWSGLDISAAPTSFNGGGTGKGGTFDQWLAVWPNAHIKAIGYSLGSGVKGDGVITSINTDCTHYTFDVPAKPAPVVGQNKGSAEPVCTLDDNGDNTGDSTVTSWTQDWTQTYGDWDAATQSYPLGEKVYQDKVYTTSEGTPDENCPPPTQIGKDHSSQQFCTQPKDGTLTTQEFSQQWEQAPVFSEGVWTLGDKEYGDVVLVSSTVTKDASCAVTVVTPPDNTPQTPTTPQSFGLAETGGSIPVLPLGIGVMLVLSGVLSALITRIVLRRRHSA
jgi:hypothetical protein